MREDGQKKAVLAKSCRLAMRQAEAKLPRVLGDPNPMPGIIKLYEEVLMPTVDRGIPEGAWPWTPFAPGIDGEVDRQLSELCQRYESQWAPVDLIGLRAVPPAGRNNGKSSVGSEVRSRLERNAEGCLPGRSTPRSHHVDREGGPRRRIRRYIRTPRSRITSL